MQDKRPKEYPFLGASEENGYLLFPKEIEEDKDTFFHGTAEKNLASIIERGFQIPGELPSVSFAKNSDLSLNYACSARNPTSPKGVVIAVRYLRLDKQYIKQESFGLHVYRFDEQPEVIGFCVIPAAYVYR